MYGVTGQFLSQIVRAHKPITRVRVLDVHQFGTYNPASIADLPVIAGDVRMTAAGDVKATIDLTVPGVWWGHVAPYGRELFVERGVEYPDGSTELVPLGYFRIDSVEQSGAPDGPVRISCSDRTAQLAQSRVIKPWQIPDGTTHADVFELLINGDAGVHCYPCFPGATVPWFADYDTSAVRVYGGVVVEDSILTTLTDLAGQQGCSLRWYEEGSLGFQRRDPVVGPPVWNMNTGPGGNLISVTRKIARDGVFNAVVAYGSNPSAPTNYQLALNEDPTSRLAANGPFGPALRFYSSPLLRTDAAASAAAATVLGRYSALPESQTLQTVPNPALRPLDNLAVFLGRQVRIVAVDQVTCPLAGSSPMQIEAREAGAPPADAGQRPSAGSATAPYQTGTIVAYDPVTNANTVDVGGATYDNLPVTGCCGAIDPLTGISGLDIGTPVTIGWADSGPIVLGPVAAYPSIDPLYGGIGGTLVTPATFRNLCPNPGLLNDANGWVFTSGARVSGMGLANDTGLRLTNQAHVEFPAFAVTPGLYYFLRWAERTFTAALNMKFDGLWEWLDAGGGVIGAGAADTGFATAGAGVLEDWTYAYTSVGGVATPMAAPAGAVFGRYKRTYSTASIPAGASSLDLGLTDVRADVMDGAHLPSGPPFFFDGNTDLGSVHAVWDGAPGNSTSSAT